MKRHPICDELRIPEPKRSDIDRIKADMEENGWDRSKPAYVFQKRILVGNTREAAAKELGIKPLRKAFKGTPEQARAFVIREELNRRHMTLEEQKAVTDARRGRVVQARKAGESVRTIADKENVAPTTIQRDLAAAGPEADAPAGKVKGKDQKEYPATADDVRCAKCKRTFPATHVSVKGCEGCKRLKAEHRATAKGRTEPGTHEPAKARGKKSGKAAYDWRRLNTAFGQLMRETDVVERVYGIKDKADGDKVRYALAEWKNKHFVIWFRKVSGTEPQAV